MKIGTRLTIVLLLCLMPVLAAYTYWSVERSNVYVNELKQSARAVSSGVAPSVDEEVIAQEWDKIGDAFRKMDAEGTRSALLRKDGTLWYSIPGFPGELVKAAQLQIAQHQICRVRTGCGREELVLRVGSAKRGGRRRHWIPARSSGLDQGGEG